MHSGSKKPTLNITVPAMSRLVGVGVLALLSATDGIAAQLGATDIERALVMARSSEQQRTAFHAPYITVVNGPVVDDYFRIEKIEVITEFRRMELIAEQQARVGNHSFGRSGTRDAEQALQPWRDRVTIVVHLRFVPTMRHVAGVPELRVVLNGDDAINPVKVSRYDTNEEVLVAGQVEAEFSASEITGTRAVVIGWNSREIERRSLDFSKLQ